MIVDGDDELIGRYVLKLFNAVYHQTKALSVYSNHLRVIKNADFYVGSYSFGIYLTERYLSRNRYLS